MVGVPTEVKNNENRVAITPDGVRELDQAGVEVLVQAGAGASSEIPDDAIDGQLGEPIPGRSGVQTNNPGFPGFGSEGWIVGAGLDLAVYY